MQITAQVVARIHHVRKLPAIDQHLSARADRGAYRFDQNIIRAERWQNLLAEFHLSRRGEEESLSFHAPNCTSDVLHQLSIA